MQHITSMLWNLPACFATGIFTWFGTENESLGVAAGMAVFAIVTAIYSASIAQVKALKKD